MKALGLGRLAAISALAFWPLPTSAQWFGSAPQLSTGQSVYEHVCQSCHMPGGVGAKSPVVKAPALAKNPLLADSRYVMRIVSRGSVAMPWFRGSLSTEQIASVVNYIRTHFGNNFETPVTAADVEAIAPKAPTREP